MSGVGPQGPPVLVAVAEVQERVLEDAIAEARRREAPLWVVTCWEPLDGRGDEEASGEHCFGEVSSVLLELARSTSDDIRDFVGVRAPDLDVTYSLVEGDPVDVLRDEARGTVEVMVGADGELPRYLFVVRGSVARRLVATSPVPTVIVPDRPAPVGGDVLLVLGSWAPDAVRFALRVAAGRGVALHVLHDSGGSGSRSYRRWQRRCHLLDTYLSLHPDVPVTVQAVPRGRLVDAATDPSRRSGLVVVGTDPRRWLPWWLDRSVAARIATRTTTPLAAVPTGDAGTRSWG